MKIIFLDMDGVLCTVRSHIAQMKRPPSSIMMEALDREAIGLLNQLATPDTRYVLSSTWRKLHSRDWMVKHLCKFGWAGTFHDDWRTIVSNRGLRGAEIAEWLDRHPEATNYVILDDDSDMLSEQLPHFVQTHVNDGLRWTDFLSANLILHGNENAFMEGMP